MQEACKKTGKQKFTVIQHRDEVKKTTDINGFYGYLQFQFNDSVKKTSVIERVWGDPHQDKSHRRTGCQTAILLNMGGSCSYLYPSI